MAGLVSRVVRVRGFDFQHHDVQPLESEIVLQVHSLEISRKMRHDFCTVCYRALDRQHEQEIGFHTEHLLQANQAMNIPRPTYGFQGEDEPDKEPELE